jgi:hypothetical protein
VVGLKRSEAAHCPQNLLSGGFTAPQTVQTEASGEAHAPQNLAPAELSCWHREHFMRCPLSVQ